MRFSSFNIVHLAAAILVVMVLVVLLLPMLGSTRGKGSRITYNSSQLRGIHQALVTYSNSNKEWFPGINAAGEDEGITIEERYQILLEDYFFTPEYAISPLETDRNIKPWDPASGAPVTAANYSYAMLQVPEQQGGRRDEWATTLNEQAIVVSDRNLGTANQPQSVHTNKPGDWAGNILWNDNHVSFESGHTFETQYGEGEVNKKDQLFQADGQADALLIHSGN